jgi:hypothetical protein
MTVTTPTTPRERTTTEPLVGSWIAFIRAMEAHYAAGVRQTDAEVRTVAVQLAAFGVQPATSLPSQQELAATAR